jgi:hypothetical protein
MEEQLGKIREELGALRGDIKKLQNKGVDKKWFTVLMAVITAVLAGTNYYFEKNIDKSAAKDLKSSETIGETSAKERIEFLIKSKERIVTLNDAFEEYCLISQDEVTLKKVVDAAADFTSLLDKTIVEMSLREDLKLYVGNVGDQVYKMANDTIDDNERKKIYQNIHEAFLDADSALDERITELVGE